MAHGIRSLSDLGESVAAVGMTAHFPDPSPRLGPLLSSNDQKNGLVPPLPSYDPSKSDRLLATDTLHPDDFVRYDYVQRIL